MKSSENNIKNIDKQIKFKNPYFANYFKKSNDMNSFYKNKDSTRTIVIT